VSTGSAPADSSLAVTLLEQDGRAAARLTVMPAVCRHGHPYLPGSFTVLWERCPCRHGIRAGQGHHLVTCLHCAAEGQATAQNVPYCYYLGF
jgi:hypothetical protein